MCYFVFFSFKENSSTNLIIYGEIGYTILTLSFSEGYVIIVFYTTMLTHFNNNSPIK